MAGNEVPSRDNPAKQRQEEELSPDEKVLEASVESFPASDPPAWIVGGATADGVDEEKDEEKEENGRPGPSRVESRARGGKSRKRPNGKH